MIGSEFNTLKKFGKKQVAWWLCAAVCGGMVLFCNCASESSGSSDSVSNPQPTNPAGERDNTADIDATTMYGKFILGYQGWFSCPGDGSPISDTWGHWFNWYAPPDAVELKVDMWPDVSELDEDELFTTNMVMPDGSPAKLFSSYKLKTVMRHFQWMQEYGIDGVFLQRFVGGISDHNSAFEFKSHVLENVRAGAEAYGRVFTIEYDTTGALPETIVEDIIRDWVYLVDTLNVTASPRYIRHKGKPVLVVWGFGFNDGQHEFSPQQANEIINWFKTAPEKYQVTLVGGVPSGWQTLRADSFSDPEWADVYRSYDILLPWTVGRYSNEEEADAWLENKLKPDIADAKSHGIEYMAVVFPGFSFHNMHRPGHGEELPPLNEIKRDGGKFYWRQIYNAILAFKASSAGYSMLKGAMFDEVDEGTALFKLAPTNTDVPIGVGFVTLDIDGYELPSDWYLTITGEGSKMLRNEIPLSTNIPSMPPTEVVASDAFYIDRVRVIWDAVAAATGYEVWRGVSNDTGQATCIGTGISVTNYDDMNATAGTPYYYWVKTTNAGGASAFSANAIGKVLFGPDVRLNGAAGPVTVAVGSELVVTVSLNPAQYTGYLMDWWVVASTPFGLYYLNGGMAWTLASTLDDCQPVYQGGLFGLQSGVTLDTTALPTGTYTFYFGLDTLNGILDQDVVYDSAIVTVAP
ncbi:MAG: hypothetical protein Q7J98_01405 [Kiritimatiellia bacterium]|nr:hypothetical protein [Kiritimatiellia bacterium]